MQLCQIFHVKIASVSLLDDCRQLIKSGCGLPPDLKYMDKRDSFCAWTLLPEYPEVLVVPDALLDMRYNLLVLNSIWVICNGKSFSIGMGSNCFCSPSRRTPF